MRTIGLGIQSFEKIRSENQFYVDKTAFIGEWYRKNDDITLVTRPRRFGKTLTIDMLNCFFSSSYAGRQDLFENLEIERDVQMMALQGTMPVIRISFSGIKGDSFSDFLINIAGRIAELLYQYRFLLKEDVLNDSDRQILEELSRLAPVIPDHNMDRMRYAEYVHTLARSLNLLSIWLFQLYRKKVYIFMDEYDTPLQTAYLNHYYEEAISFMRELFSASFKDNEWMDRAVITGITRIAKESLFSEMNNLAVYSVVSGGYDTAFGFTQREMDAILDEYDLTAQRDLLRFWYDGFTVGEETGIYNPWSVISYLSRRHRPPTDYWAQSGGIGLVDHLMRRGGVNLKEGFQTLLSGGTIERRIKEDLIFPRLDGDENAVWSLLIAAGYVKALPDPTEDQQSNSVFSGIVSARTPKTMLTLTNHESLICLSEMVEGWFSTRAGNFMEGFAEAVIRNDLWEMNAHLQRVVMECASIFDSGVKPSDGNVQPENYFHGLTLGMLTCLSDLYRLSSNREAGFGRYDVCLEPLSTEADLDPCIFEFKVYNEKEGDQTLEDTARRARMQIDEKQYDAELAGKGYMREKIRKYGVGFRGKEVLIMR